MTVTCRGCGCTVLSREALARALYNEWRQRNPGDLTWDNDSRAEGFRAQADRLLVYFDGDDSATQGWTGTPHLPRAGEVS